LGPPAADSFVLTLIRVAATGHPWPGAAQSASMPIAPRISARTQPAPYVAFGGEVATVGEKRCLFLGVLWLGFV